MSSSPWPTEPTLFGRANWRQRSDRLLASLRLHVPEEILAAAWSQPNTAGLPMAPAGLTLIAYGVAFVLQQWVIWRRDGLAHEALWVVTPDRLIILDAHEQPLGGAALGRRLGAWDRRAIAVERVREPSFAVAFDRPGSTRVEMCARRHDQPAFSLIQMLVEPEDAAEALALARKAQRLPTRRHRGR